MSVEYFIGLVGELPDLRVLDARLADFGGVDGDWAKGIEIAGVGIHPKSDPEGKADVLTVLEESLRDDAKPALPLKTVLVVSHGPFDTVLSIGELLLSFSGGVLSSEDGELLHFEPGPKELAPLAPPQALDVSIPPLVEQQFATEQHLYALAVRSAPTVAFAALVKKLSAKPARVRGGAWDRNSIGQVVLRRHLPHEFAHWAGELTAVGCEAPVALFRLSFEHWHVKSVSGRDWRDMLAVVCGLGRATGGVLYRIDAPNEARFDFAPSRPSASESVPSNGTTSEAANASPKPLPKFVQYILLALVLAACAGFIYFVRPSTRPCTVKQTFGNDDICVVGGKLEGVDQRNKELNAKRLGNVDLDEIIIADDTGTRAIYFDPTRLSFAGRTTVRVTGKEIEERGSGVRRFVISKIE